MYPYTIHLPDLKTEKITLGNKCRLKNFYRIGDGVYRSDQPSAACFRELEKFGMREILNLRCYHTDTKEAQGTSLILHHLPTRATLLRLDDLVTAMQIIRYIHTTRGKKDVWSTSPLRPKSVISSGPG